MKFLNIEDRDIIITNIVVDENTKEIHLEKTLQVEYCPACSSRMYSKGRYVRKINHPILQDGYCKGKNILETYILILSFLVY